MHLESLIEEVGGFGTFQMRLIPILSCSRAILVPSMLMMVFAGKEPDWWCESRDADNITIFRNESFQNCQWNSTCERRYDDAIMITAVSEWDLVCDKAWIVNTIISIQMAGVFIGDILCGYCSDTYGRKKMLYSGVLLCTIGNIVSAFSVSWIMFTVLRFIIGVSLGLSLPVVYLYQVEFVGRKWRGLIASLPSWPVGVLYCAGLSWGIQNWKWMHIAVAVPCFLFLLTWSFVPESLRWLTVKGHLMAARRVVKKMAAVNKKPVPDTSILELIAAEERAEGDKARNYTYLDLFKTKHMARTTFFTCYIWFSMSMVTYTIAFGVKDLSGDFYLNFMIMALLEMPRFLVTLFMVYLFPRRLAAAILFIAATVCVFGVAISTRLAREDIKGTLENSLAITARMMANCAWGVSQAMTSEQFPTVVRNLASAAQNTSARIGGIVAAQLLSLGANNDLLPPYVALGVVQCVTAGVCFTLEETKKKPLEDTMNKAVAGTLSVEETMSKATTATLIAEETMSKVTTATLTAEEPMSKATPVEVAVHYDTNESKTSFTVTSNDIDMNIVNSENSDKEHSTYR